MSKLNSIGQPIELDLDEWFQIWVADQVAADLGLLMTWEKVEGGLIIGMGKLNESIVD